MKTISKIFILILTMTISIKSHSQSSSGATGKENLSGTWIASCPIEYQDKASMMNCALCPIVINPQNRSEARIKDIEMTFWKTSIVINRNGDIQTVPYEMEKKKHTFSFKYNNKKHKFRVFYSGDGVILEDADGLIMTLERKYKAKTIAISDMRNSGIAKLDTAIAGHQDGDVYINRIMTLNHGFKFSKKDTIVAFQIHFLRPKGEQLKNYDMDLESDEDFNKATYIWMTDSIVSVTLINETNHKRRNLKLVQPEASCRGCSAGIMQESLEDDEEKK